MASTASLKVPSSALPTARMRAKGQDWATKRRAPSTLVLMAERGTFCHGTTRGPPEPVQAPTPTDKSGADDEKKRRAEGAAPAAPADADAPYGPACRLGDGAKLGTSDAVVTQWEQIKLKEKGAKKPTVFKDLPPSLNAILTAREVWKQVRKKQLDAGATVDAAQVDAQSHGLTEEAAGRKLFELIAACRDAGEHSDGHRDLHVDH